MKLTEMKSRREGRLARFTGRPADDRGQAQYELTVTGPAPLVKRVFGAAEIELSISPAATQQQAEARAKELAKRSGEGLPALLQAPHALRAKRPPAAPTAQRSVYVALRRLEGEGTLWGISIPAMPVPKGVSVFFVLPPVMMTSALVVPAAGDADLFLSLNGPAPTVAASVAGGLTPDAVSFGTFPFFFPFVPFFRVFGFLASVTSFTAIGFGVP
jgi:hypothetical protein